MAGASSYEQIPDLILAEGIDGKTVIGEYQLAPYKLMKKL